MNGSKWLLSLCWSAFACQALTTEEWQKQSIYSLMTDRFATSGNEDTPCSLIEKAYCGGTWQGIIDQLDYIQGMGFTAVWISPVVKNLDKKTDAGYSYHGYWTEDIWSLNSHFGSEDDLKDLSDELHGRGMYLMVDIVINHMAPTVEPANYTGSNRGGQLNYTTYTTYNPFNSSSYFHDPCFINNEDPESVIKCRINDAYVNLPDLKTEDVEVQNIFQTWIADLVSKYEIDGLRIDTVKHVEKSFWPPFIEASGVFSMAEIFDGDPRTYQSDWSTYVSGVVNFPAYYWILRAFQSRSQNMEELTWGMGQMKDTGFLFGNFIENHDTSRFAHFAGDMAMTRNALVFMMMMDGMPVINQGQEQHYSGAGDPHNREPLWTSGYDADAELYQWIATLNSVRTMTIDADEGFVSTKASVIFNNTHIIAMKKGAAITIATNVGTGGVKSQITLTQKASGAGNLMKYVDVLSCDEFKSTGNGSLIIDMGWEARVILPAKTLQEAGFECKKPDNKPKCLVNFRLNVTTTFGEQVKMLGNAPELGGWANTSSIALDAAGYPVWSQFVEIEPGTDLEWVYLKDNQGADKGDITYESDGMMHTLNVPDTCANSVKVIEVNSEWDGATDSLTIDMEQSPDFTMELDVVSMEFYEANFLPPKCKLGPPSVWLQDPEDTFDISLKLAVKGS